MYSYIVRSTVQYDQIYIRTFCMTLAAKHTFKKVTYIFILSVRYHHFLSSSSLIFFASKRKISHECARIVSLHFPSALSLWHACERTPTSCNSSTNLSCVGVVCPCLACTARAPGGSFSLSSSSSSSSHPICVCSTVHTLQYFFR